jgi:hypothetical protein
MAAWLHLAAFLCLVASIAAILTGTASLAGWGWPATIATLAATGALLYLEQRWAEDVHLAFFKVNVLVGFGVLAAVLVARSAGGF